MTIQLSTYLTSGSFPAVPVSNGGTGTTMLMGILKGNGTGAVTTAVAGVDYIDPINAGGAPFSDNNILAQIHAIQLSF